MAAKSDAPTISSIAFPKQTPSFVVKFAVVLLLLGLSFRLFTSQYFDYSTAAVVSPPGVDDLSPTKTTDARSSSIKDNAVSDTKPKCDIFDGDWIPYKSPPAYTNRTCHIIEDHQNCIKNGRPDTAYMKWRWSPRHCNLPHFNAERFLDLMRDKSWGFIGDSISRNHVQSFVCVLSQVEPAVEIYHDPAYRSKKWRFPSYNFTVSVIWTPFLVRADIFEDDNGVSTSETQLHLDKIDESWTKEYSTFTHVIIGGGKWFLKTTLYYENEELKGCHYCHGEKNLTELGFDFAYRKALKLVFNYFTASSPHKAFVIFRTITPDHFENGEWNTGGTCIRKAPFKEGEAEMSAVDRILREVEMDEFEKASRVAAGRGVELRMLDTTRLSLLRPDGHPGPYRQFYPFAKDKNAKVQNDCLHWCLPGPIDSWNDLVMDLLVNG